MRTARSWTVTYDSCMNDTKPRLPRIGLGALGAVIAIADAYLAYSEFNLPCPPGFNLDTALLVTVFTGGAPMIFAGFIGVLAALKLPKRIRLVLMFSPLLLLGAWPIIERLPHAVPALYSAACAEPNIDF